MIEPTKADIGRHVTYVKRVHYSLNSGNEGEPTAEPETENGVIVDMNDAIVFVLFDGDTGAKATRREDLQWND